MQSKRHQNTAQEAEQQGVIHCQQLLKLRITQLANSLVVTNKLGNFCKFALGEDEKAVDDVPSHLRSKTDTFQELRRKFLAFVRNRITQKRCIEACHASR
jgi:hypothetical protein